jgi:hypothetical protein
LGGPIYISPQVYPWTRANHAEKRCSSHPDFSLTKWTSDFFMCEKSRDYFIYKQLTMLKWVMSSLVEWVTSLSLVSMRKCVAIFKSWSVLLEHFPHVLTLLSSP